jgi:hypothetical protein
MSGDGTLLNDDVFMSKILSGIKELEDYKLPLNHKFYIGDMVKINGVLSMWDGEKWANNETVYMVQE